MEDTQTTLEVVGVDYAEHVLSAARSGGYKVADPEAIRKCMCNIQVPGGKKARKTNRATITAELIQTDGFIAQMQNVIDAGRAERKSARAAQCDALAQQAADRKARGVTKYSIMQLGGSHRCFEFEAATKDDALKIADAKVESWRTGHLRYNGGCQFCSLMDDGRWNLEEIYGK